MSAANGLTFPDEAVWLRTAAVQFRLPLLSACQSFSSKPPRATDRPDQAHGRTLAPSTSQSDSLCGLMQNLGDCRPPSEDLYHAMSTARPKSQPDRPLPCFDAAGSPGCLSSVARASRPRQYRVSQPAARPRAWRAGFINGPMRTWMRTIRLAEASKLVPKGVICLTSALTYHGLRGPNSSACLARHRGPGTGDPDSHIPRCDLRTIRPSNWRAVSNATASTESLSPSSQPRKR